MQGNGHILFRGVSWASHTPYLAVVSFWWEHEPQHVHMLCIPLVRVCGMSE